MTTSSGHAARPGERVSDDGLVVDDVEVRFGGLNALDSVSVHAPPGRLTALIGPNGAGKTTFFNVVSGLVSPARGVVRLFGEDITKLAAPTRAQRGLGRTYQQVRLFDGLSVAQNISLGREAGLAGSNPVRQLIAGRRGRAEVERAARDAVEFCGLQDLTDAQPSELTTGQRRMVELARTVAGGFRVLMLDEPSAGLDRSETGAMGEIFRRLIEDRGVAVVLVEHDMELVMSVSDYVYVIDFGRPLFEGKPGDVGRSDVVRAAYLGTEATEEQACSS